MMNRLHHTVPCLPLLFPKFCMWLSFLSMSITPVNQASYNIYTACISLQLHFTFTSWACSARMYLPVTLKVFCGHVLILIWFNAVHIHQWLRFSGRSRTRSRIILSTDWEGLKLLALLWRLWVSATSLKLTLEKSTKAGRLFPATRCHDYHAQSTDTLARTIIRVRRDADTSM